MAAQHGEQCNEDAALISEDFSGEERISSRCWGLGTVKGTIVGISVLAACVSASLCAVLLGANAPLQTEFSPISARRLFESPNVIKAGADAIMMTGIRRKELSESDRPAVEQRLTKDLKAIGDRIALTPDLAKHLDAHILSGKQHRAVAARLRIAGDERVQAIGALVHKAILESDPDEDKDDLKEHIRETLKPRKAELVALYDELMPKDLQNVMDYQKGTQWKNLLAHHRHGPKERRLQSSIWGATTPTESSSAWGSAPTASRTGGWGAAPSPATPTTYGSASFGSIPKIGAIPSKPFDFVEEAYSAIETAKAMIDAMEMMQQIGGNEMELGDKQKYLDALQASVDLMECMVRHVEKLMGTGEDIKEMTTVTDNMKSLDGMVGVMQLLTCPEDIGSDGVNAIESVAKEFGITNIPFLDTEKAATRRRRSSSSSSRRRAA